MSVSFPGPGDAPIIVKAGDELLLTVGVSDPTGISKVLVECFQFSLAASNRTKVASGVCAFRALETMSRLSIDVGVRLPENAALGRWGIRRIEFTNGRGYKTSFYRGQGKFDNITFDVIAPTSEEESPLRLDSVKITGSRNFA